jgi:hypothetical protein
LLSIVLPNFEKWPREIRDAKQPWIPFVWIAPVCAGLAVVAGLKGDIALWASAWDSSVFQKHCIRS